MTKADNHPLSVFHSPLSAFGNHDHSAKVAAMITCDFCELPATCAVEALDGSATAYLCSEHLPVALNADGWFEPAAIAPELDPRSGLPGISGVW